MLYSDCFGFQSGFSLYFDGNKYPHSSKNLLLAHQNPKVIDDKIKKEVELGRRVAGSFSSPFSRNFVSQLGVVPKRKHLWNIVLLITCLLLKDLL